MNFYHCLPKFADMLLEIMLLSLHPNIIVHVENVVSLFSSPSTSSQKVRKCGSHNSLLLLDRVLVNFYHCLPKFADMLLENNVAFITP